MINIIKRLFCKHNNLTFIRNIYGDQINMIGTVDKISRSEYVCNNCGKRIYEDKIYKEK